MQAVQLRPSETKKKNKNGETSRRQAGSPTSTLAMIPLPSCRALVLAVAAGLLKHVHAECLDVGADCLGAAIAGECTANAAYMAVNCKASCGFCDASTASGIDESALDSVPFLFSGQGYPPSPEQAAAFGDDDKEAEFVGGDISVVLMQPLLADRCCWGGHAMVRYETHGALSVPEDGVVVFRFAGKEADVMPFARGEFGAFVRDPGRYEISVAVESHDRSQCFARAHAELLVAAQGPVDVVNAPDQLEGEHAEAAEWGQTQVLRHALHPHPEASCAVHCMSSDDMAERRADAALRLYERDRRVQPAQQSGTGGVSAKGFETFVLQIGACDGELADPIHRYMHEYEWAGLLVEPLPDLFDRLKRNYANAKGRVQFANVAVTDPGQTCRMLRVPADLVDAGDAPDWALGVSSFFESRSAVGGKGATAQDFATYSSKQQLVNVTCMTLGELLASYAVSHVDFLQVDAEGYDAKILAQMDLTRWQPAVVALETINLPADELLDVYKTLRVHGYDVISDGRDILALRQPVTR